jgi:hypothetical protein
MELHWGRSMRPDRFEYVLDRNRQEQRFYGITVCQFALGFFWLVDFPVRPSPAAQQSAAPSPDPGEALEREATLRRDG